MHYHNRYNSPPEPINIFNVLLHAKQQQEEHMSGVNNIIDDASLFEEPDEIRARQHMRDQTFLELNKISERDV